MSRYIVKFRESAVKAGSGNQQVTVVDSMGVFRAGCSGSNPIYIYNLYIHECMHVHAHIVQLESRLLEVLLTLLTPLDSRQSKKKAFVLHHDRIYVVILRVKSSPEMNYYYKSQKLRENTTKLNAKTPQIC